MSGDDLLEVVKRKTATARSLDGWGLMDWPAFWPRLRGLGFGQRVCWMLILP